MVFKAILIGQFYWWGNRRKPMTCWKSLTNFIT